MTDFGGNKSTKQITDSEEVFLTLLQRIQRLYVAEGGGGVGNINDDPFPLSSSSHHGLLERPPDEAASSLGKQLAISFQTMIEDKGGVIKKGIHEKLMIGLTNNNNNNNTTIHHGTVLNPAIIETFFTTLLGMSSSTTTAGIDRVISMEFLPIWILHCEQIIFEQSNEKNISFDSLTATIRAYACYNKQKLHATNGASTKATTKTNTANAADTTATAGGGGVIGPTIVDSQQIATTYRKLQSSTSRIAMGREFTKVAFNTGSAGDGHNNDFNLQLRSLLSPIMSASVLSLSTPIHESIYFLDGLFRECWAELGKTGGDGEEQYEMHHHATSFGHVDFLNSCYDMINFMTTSLDYFLLGIPCRNSLEQKLSCKELGLRWLIQILEMSSYLVQSLLAVGNDHQEQDEADQDNVDDEYELNPITIASMSKMSKWLHHILNDTIVTLYATIPTYRISLQPALAQIQIIIDRLNSSHSGSSLFLLKLNPVTTLRLCTLSLSCPVKEDVNSMLRILCSTIQQQNQKQQKGKGTKRDTSSDKNLSIYVHGILRATASMFVRDDVCSNQSKDIIESILQQQSSFDKNHDSGSRKIATVGSGGHNNNSSEHSHSLRGVSSTVMVSSARPICNTLQFLDPSVVNVDDFLSFLSRSNTFGAAAKTTAMSNTTAAAATTIKTIASSIRLSSMQQSAALLLGIALLENNDETTQNVAYVYLRNLLSKYSHLGVSLLPVLIDSINTASIKGYGNALVQHLGFICDTVALDKQCAVEIWNLLGMELMRQTIPSVIRATVIRLFPKLCSANKRLYKRVIEALGRNLSQSTNQEIRLAIAATVAELAKADQIRDVTDVIGWIQGFISDVGWVRQTSTMDSQLAPSNASLVHYAILSLHYLVVAQELDFHLVLVVLNKRLCNVHDRSEVLKLPLIVLESLSLLLGDGECEDDSDDEQQENDPSKGISTLSVQVTRSVETLIEIGLSQELRPSYDSGVVADELEWGVLRRCRRNIFESLSRYSFEALGIDEEGLRAIAISNSTGESTVPIPPSGDRFHALRQVIQDGMESLASDDPPLYITTPEEVKDYEQKDAKALIALTSKILRFEEDVLGSSLWQKRGKHLSGPNKKIARGTVQIDPTAEPTQMEALPSTTSIQQIYNESRSPASSIAALLCFDGKPLSLLTDLAGDVSNESSEPLFLALTVQGWLNACKRTLMEIAMDAHVHGLDSVLDEIREWRLRLDSPDNMYLALAALATFIPETVGRLGDHSSTIREICNEVWHAYTEHEFDNGDVAKLSLGLIGVLAVRTRNVKFVEDVVVTLEKSVSGYGGQTSFGAYYALAIIAQTLPSYCDDPGSFDESEPGIDRGYIGRIVAFLVNELISCIKGDHVALRDLVSGIREGIMTPDVVDALTTFRRKSLHLIETKRRVAKSLFVAFAVCLPSLSSVNEELLLGVYCLLESLQWGTGKGIALPPVLRACRKCRLFDNREIEKIYAKYARVFEEGINQSIDGLDDIFYAVTATMSKTIPYNIRRFLVGNRTLFDTEGRAVSVLAAVVSLSSLPCLGIGAEAFTETARLNPAASKDDVSGVVELVSEGANSRDWNQYSQTALILMGFMAAMNTGEVTLAIDSLPREAVVHSVMGDSNRALLPTPQQGTVLEVIMTILVHWYHNPQGLPNDKARNEVVRLLGCLEELSLPGHFAAFLEQMFRGSDDDVKTSCLRLLLSQIRGRRRAVFDGREYIELAVKIATSPVSTLRSLLGQGGAPVVFIESMVDILPKVPAKSIEDALENLWRLCINQVGHSPAWTMSFLTTVKTLLKNARDIKSLSSSPKTINFIRLFVLKRVFAGIRDAPLASISSPSPTNELTIVDLYALCLLEIPIPTLVEAEFFSLKELDGFVGEALRNRCVMTLVKLGYFTSPSRASSEISSSIAWFSRQLVSSEDEIFSSSLLHVCCAIAEASLVENTDRKREILLSLLDNLLLTSSAAGSVGLQMLSALVALWSNSAGSDGDLSLACLCVAGIEKWQSLSPPTVQHMFQLMVHDMPYNLAAYCRREKLSGVVFNRLWRIYNKWWEQGADQAAIDNVRKALICCRSVDSGSDDFVSLATSMLL